MNDRLAELEAVLLDVDERLRELEQYLLDTEDECEVDEDDEGDEDVEDAVDLFEKLYEPLVDGECDAFVCGYIEGLAERK